MRQSIGYTATLNIIIVFIAILFAFIFAAINYYKAFKVSNIVTDVIEEYEGYNGASKTELAARLTNIGYNMQKINCAPISRVLNSSECNMETSSLVNDGISGYCIYYCDLGNNYYQYKVRTNMFMNVPVINDILNIPVYSTTNELYDFEKVLNSRTVEVEGD